MITIDTLESRFSGRFSSFDRITESVARCVRSNQGRAFAVYYIDVSERLPASIAELDEYQDRIVASRYFEGGKSLQWSHYLYFVVSQTVPSEVRTLVERDRKYARKFVVDEQELESALTPPAFQVAEGVVDASVFNNWSGLLVESNLDHAVFSGDSLPQRIKRIEAEFGHKGLGAPSGVTIRPKEVPPFIATLELIQYRPCPKQRSFDFGTVTLLTGQNGAGKTSLLEAVEVLYCGANKRDPKSKTPFRVKGTFRDGKSATASNKVPTTAELRDRNLAWYGQTDLRGSTLYQSFARYNFLDTDAAVAIASSESDFEKELSKLLVGPEASKTWKEIERTYDGLQKHVKELSAVEQQVKSELRSVEKQITSAAAVPKESDSLCKALSKTLTESGWSMPAEDLADNLSHLTSVFATFEPIVEQAMSCDWTGSPVTIRTIRDFSDEVEQVVVEAEQAFASCQATSKKLQDNRKESESCARREQSARELSRYLEMSFLEAEQRLSNDERRLQEIRAKLPVKRLDVANAEQLLDLTLTLSELQGHCSTLLDRSQAAHHDSETQLAGFNKQRDHALGLSQQLRDIAAQILSQSERKDVCPLCHTEFSDGELSRQIYHDIDSLLEAESTKIRDVYRQTEASLANAKTMSVMAELLLEVAAQNDLPQDVRASIVVELVRDLQDQDTTIQSDIAVAQDACQQLRTQGLSVERYEALVKALFAEDLESRPSSEQLNTLVKQVTEERATLSRDGKALEKDLAEQNQHATRLLGTEITTLQECQKALSKRKDERDLVDSLLKRIDMSEAQKLINDDTPLADLLTTLKVIRKLLTDLQTAMTNEQQAVVMASESAKRRDEILRQLDGLEPRIKRCRDAEEVFRTILEDHSLAGAMEEALQQNKAAIEEIFRRIHSPAEFSGLQDMTTLIRKDGQEAKLHQVSTGQRAAYALSLFLAQNAQLRSAPQLMLIDDPIAHVDDLNCLSFLDYLREVALSGDRQIVFATANEKLASLFHRKFDFLGEDDFRRHDMSR